MLGTVRVSVTGSVRRGEVSVTGTVTVSINGSVRRGEVLQDLSLCQ